MVWGVCQGFRSEKDCTSIEERREKKKRRKKPSWKSMLLNFSLFLDGNKCCCSLVLLYSQKNLIELNKQKIEIEKNF
jgi:hypothetical protein